MSFIKENFNRPQPASKGTPKSKPRIEFIDLAKGLCIILVVMVHANVDFSIPNFQALRMPLYFVLSGLFFRDYGGLLNLTERKINKLLIPFISFYILSFIVIWTGKALFHPEPLSLSHLWDPLFSRPLVNGPLWFLLALFGCNIFYFYTKRVHSHIGRILIVVFLASLGIICANQGFRLPLFLDSSLISFPFFYMGVILGSLDFLYPNKYDKYVPLFSILLVGFGYILYFFFDSPVITTFDVTWHSSLLLAYINSSFMVVGVLLLCKMVRWLPIISYMGRYSIIILVLHSLILGNLAVLVELIIGAQLNRWYAFVYTLLLCWLLIPVMRKYLPHVTAQKDWFSFSKIKGLFTPPPLINVNEPNACYCAIKV